MFAFELTCFFFKSSLFLFKVQEKEDVLVEQVVKLHTSDPHIARLDLSAIFSRFQRNVDHSLATSLHGYVPLLLAIPLHVLPDVWDVPSKLPSRPASSEFDSHVDSEQPPQKDNDQKFDLLDHRQDLHHNPRAYENKDSSRSPPQKNEANLVYLHLIQHSVGFPACRKQHHNSRNDHPPNVAANPHVEHPGDWCLRHEQLLT